MKDIDLWQGDCLEIMRTMPSGSVDLVLTDPPYNIGVKTQKNGEADSNAWDKIDDYENWCIEWLRECQRLLKPSGVLYFWHNDMAQIAELLHRIRAELDLVFVSFCIWDKGDTYRARSWLNRKPDSATALRSWFNICEYCLHFFNAPKDADRAWQRTGLERIYSNPECFKPIKDWYAAEKTRLGITDKDIAAKYTEVTGKKPYMLRHYFQNTQFGMPTEQIWRTVYEPLGFDRDHGALRSAYEALRRDYEALRRDYEALRNVHNCDARHCNIWHIPPIPSSNRLHTCQKPVALLERLVRVSSPVGGVVLDCFMGSGSTGVVAMGTGRRFIGIEKDAGYFAVAKARLERENRQTVIDFNPSER